MECKACGAKIIVSHDDLCCDCFEGTGTVLDEDGPEECPHGFTLDEECLTCGLNTTEGVQTIGAWITVHKQALDDEPALQSLINNQLLVNLARSMDQAILEGWTPVDLPEVHISDGIDADMFVRNQVSITAEQRFAPPGWTP